MGAGFFACLREKREGVGVFIVAAAWARGLGFGGIGIGRLGRRRVLAFSRQSLCVVNDRPVGNPKRKV
jgi:hypothetical protein